MDILIKRHALPQIRNRDDEPFPPPTFLTPLSVIFLQQTRAWKRSEHQVEDGHFVRASSNKQRIDFFFSNPARAEKVILLGKERCSSIEKGIYVSFYLGASLLVETGQRLDGASFAHCVLSVRSFVDGDSVFEISDFGAVVRTALVGHMLARDVLPKPSSPQRTKGTDESSVIDRGSRAYIRRHRFSRLRRWVPGRGVRCIALGEHIISFVPFQNCTTLSLDFAITAPLISPRVTSATRSPLRTNSPGRGGKGVLQRLLSAVGQKIPHFRKDSLSLRAPPLMPTSHTSALNRSEYVERISNQLLPHRHIVDHRHDISMALNSTPTRPFPRRRTMALPSRLLRADEEPPTRRFSPSLRVRPRAVRQQLPYKYAFPVNGPRHTDDQGHAIRGWKICFDCNNRRQVRCYPSLTSPLKSCLSRPYRFFYFFSSSAHRRRKARLWPILLSLLAVEFKDSADFHPQSSWPARSLIDKSNFLPSALVMPMPSPTPNPRLLLHGFLLAIAYTLCFDDDDTPICPSTTKPYTLYTSFVSGGSTLTEPLEIAPSIAVVFFDHSRSLVLIGLLNPAKDPVRHGLIVHLDIHHDGQTFLITDDDRPPSVTTRSGVENLGLPHRHETAGPRVLEVEGNGLLAGIRVKLLPEGAKGELHAFVDPEPAEAAATKISRDDQTALPRIVIGEVQDTIVKLEGEGLRLRASRSAICGHGEEVDEGRQSRKGFCQSFRRHVNIAMVEMGTTAGTGRVGLQHRPFRRVGAQAILRSDRREVATFRHFDERLALDVEIDLPKGDFKEAHDYELKAGLAEFEADGDGVADGVAGDFQRQTDENVVVPVNGFPGGHAGKLVALVRHGAELEQRTRGADPVLVEPSGATTETVTAEAVVIVGRMVGETTEPGLAGSNGDESKGDLAEGQGVCPPFPSEPVQLVVVLDNDHAQDEDALADGVEPDIVAAWDLVELEVNAKLHAEDLTVEINHVDEFGVEDLETRELGRERVKMFILPGSGLDIGANMEDCLLDGGRQRGEFISHMAFQLLMDEIGLPVMAYQEESPGSRHD
ncbi:hypothetical protein L249_8631 [Ophiocordyceps polyrhachis-furcata BCC 54312]|uniref:Uncharacterized protein n=1 Tax=Ophiocordyceps polyrhachis-furcata BCC 54312 TaxID=1330021 RepID=A0A367L6B8_9HYPO|nr:hypothetical protein L249_8631 [Ophiocordyceps polyrhachis-furcata BCC 54312]